MDSERRSSRKGILAILTAVLLIFLLVFAMNRKEGGTGTDQAGLDSSAEQTLGTAQATYGVRIGDNLKAFLSDPDFFDTEPPTGSMSSEEGENKALSFYMQAGGGRITLTFVDETSCVVTGQRISVVICRKSEQYTAELTYTDDNQDGIIIAEGLSPGIWEIKVNTLLGYRVPQDIYEVMLDMQADAETNSDESANSGESVNSDESADTGEASGDAEPSN